MTEQPAAPSVPAVPGRRLRWVLIASLAVNLAFGGMMLGAFLHGGPGGRDMVRDLGFGPYDAALRPEDRVALRSLLRARDTDLTAVRAEARNDFRVILTALRAEPFDAAALNAALGVQQGHLTARMTLGNQTLRDFLAGLSPVDRKDFADRLEARLTHGRDSRPDAPR